MTIKLPTKDDLKITGDPTRYTSTPFNDKLFLVVNSLKAPKAKVSQKAPTIAVNHIAVLDCSGSMSYDLPQIRDQLKKKLPKLLGENDTISIIWFSGKGQFGTLLEGETVQSLTELSTINATIDRWLKPVGMTGFKEPLEEVGRLAQRLQAKAPSSVVSMFMLSDGCDNVSTRTDILNAAAALVPHVQSATFVSYGYYADNPLLANMAEKLGGSLILSSSFDKFMPAFEQALAKQVSNSARTDIKLDGDVIGGFAFAVDGKDLVTFGLDGNKISVPANLESVAYLSPTSLGNATTTPEASLLYAAISLFSIRMSSDIVYPLLKVSGDVAFIEQFANCFGKQKYTDFQQLAKAAALDATQRLTKGYDPSKVPNDDAFTVLDLLRLLGADSANTVLIDDPNFNYNKIGRGTLDASENFSAAEQKQLQQFTAQLADKDPVVVAAAVAGIDALKATKQAALVFDADQAPGGYSVTNLVFNEERPNVSIKVQKTGNVDLSKRLPTTLAKVPDVIYTHVYRNYAIIKDGIINLDVLPVRVTKVTYDKLAAVGVTPALATADAFVTCVVDLMKLPVINRNMVKHVAAKVLFETEWALLKARAAQKVFNTYKKAFDKPGVAFSVLYGTDGAAWLKEQGITEGGFAPKVVQDQTTDFYTSKQLDISIKGYSTLPTLEKAKEAIAKKKINGPNALMQVAINEVESFLVSDVYTKAPNKDQLFETWLGGKAKEATEVARVLLSNKAEMVFSIVVGQVWPFASIDTNTYTLEVDGLKLECKLLMSEKEIHI